MQRLRIKYYASDYDLAFTAINCYVILHFKILDYDAHEEVLFDKCCKQKCSLQFIENNVCAKVRHTRDTSVPVMKDTTRKIQWKEEKKFCGEELIQTAYRVCYDQLPGYDFYIGKYMSSIYDVQFCHL